MYWLITIFFRFYILCCFVSTLELEKMQKKCVYTRQSVYVYYRFFWAEPLSNLFFFFKFSKNFCTFFGFQCIFCVFCSQILGVSCLLLISHHDVAFFLNERLTSSVMLFLCPTSVHNGAVLLICYLGSHKTFSMVRPSLFVSIIIIIIIVMMTYKCLFVSIISLS